jgi:SAM-dependent methyltransferase
MQPSVSTVRALYDKAYAHPGLMGTHVDREYSSFTKSTLLRMCQGAPNVRLLDLGTGDGDLWQFAAPSLEWHAIDISVVGLQRTQSRYPKIQGAVATAELLPYPDGFFGTVIAADTMEHIFDLDLGLQEVKRILAPKGRFALSVPAPNSLRTWAYNRFLRQIPSPALFARLIWVAVKRQLLFGRAAFQPIDRDLSLDDWSARLVANGFKPTELVEWPPRPLSPIVYLIGTHVTQ